MANIAINPTCKLETAYFLPDVAGTMSADEFLRLANILETSGHLLPGTAMSQIMCYANASQYSSDVITVAVSLDGQLGQNSSIDILVSKGSSLIAEFNVANYNRPAMGTAYQWLKAVEMEPEYYEWEPVTTEQTINVGSTVNGVTSFTSGGIVYEISQELNEHCLPFVYMKGDTPTPTEEDFKYYIDRVRKFIVRMAGKKVSEGE